jgi:ADP-ribosylglycohydrolase
MPEDDDLNFTLLATLVLEQHGASFTSVDVAKAWLDYLPPGRIFTAERVACRNLLLGLLPPETATHHNPFREWIGARLRVDAYGWAAPGDPQRAARMAWEDAQVSHTANGVYAAMFMAAAHAATLAEVTAGEAADIGLHVVPAQTRLAEAIRVAREATGDWEAIVDRLYEQYGSLHWVHAINNTALVAAAMYHCASFDEAIGNVVGGGWDTDTNGAAIGSIFGALAGAGGIDARWSAPLHDTIASSLPGFDASSLDGLAQRTLAVA